MSIAMINGSGSPNGMERDKLISKYKKIGKLIMIHGKKIKNDIFLKGNRNS